LTDEILPLKGFGCVKSLKTGSISTFNMVKILLPIIRHEKEIWEPLHWYSVTTKTKRSCHTAATAMKTKNNNPVDELRIIIQIKFKSKLQLFIFPRQWIWGLVSEVLQGCRDMFIYHYHIVTTFVYTIWHATLIKLFLIYKWGTSGKETHKQGRNKWLFIFLFVPKDQSLTVQREHVAPSLNVCVWECKHACMVVSW